MQIIPYNSSSIQPAQITLVQATYNGNDAGGPAAVGLPADTWAVLGQPMVLSTAFPSREGYRFLNWNTAANGQGVSYQPGETISSVSSDITLYAQWEATGPFFNTIEYYNNAPYPPAYNMPAPTPVVGGSAVISMQIPIREGYVFTGWNTSPDGIGITYQPGQAVSGLEAGLGLYAQWMAIGGGDDCCQNDCCQDNCCQDSCCQNNGCQAGCCRIIGCRGGGDCWRPRPECWSRCVC